MRPAQHMTIREYLKAHGPRQTASQLVNKRVYQACGISMNDLPDRSELWDIVDELEEVLIDMLATMEHDHFSDLNEDEKRDISAILSQIDLDFIETLIY